MEKKAILISIHSRKGGVGKTSIGMSTAIQLAALGYKVAFLDLDTMGAHLSQSLPFKDDLQEEDGVLKFSREREGKYKDKVYLVTRLFPSNAGRNVSRPSVDSIAQHLAIESTVRDMASSDGIGRRLAMIEDNLNLFPMSPYIRDIDLVNRLALSRDGQNTYREALAELLSELDSANYNYVIMDNSPGLSFNPGVSLHTAILEPKKGRRVFNWFVGNAPWWEHGLIVYEINIYSRLLAKLDTKTTLIVNRVGQKWLDDEQFSVGEYVPIESGSKQFTKLACRLFSTPMWMTSGTPPHELAKDFLLPGKFATAIIGDDDVIRKAQMTESDSRIANGTSNGELSCEDFQGDFRREFVIMAQRYLELFVLPAIKAVQDNTSKGTKSSKRSKPATSSTISPFHNHVYKALVAQVVVEAR